MTEPRAPHVLHVITGLFRGGAETMLHRLVQALSREAGFTHSIISLMDGNQFDFDALGVPVRTLGLRRGAPTPAALARLRRMIGEAKPGLLHGWMYHGNVAASLAVAGSAGVPVMWGIHNSLHDLAAEKPMTRVLIRTGSLLARQAKLHHIVYCSDASRAQHEAIGYPAAKSVYIPNGFDCMRFTPAPERRLRLRAQLQVGDDSVLIGNAARFHPVKNHVGLIRAFSAVAHRHPRARLVLAGLGVSRDNAEVMAAVRSGGHEDKILLLGERDDIPELFAGLDLFVLASHSEAFPNVLGEAMACGLPCVTTEVGDASAIVGDTGFVVAAGDERRLASALDDALSLPAGERRVLGQRARSRIVETYSMPLVAGRYAALYREVLGAPRR